MTQPDPVAETDGLADGADVAAATGGVADVAPGVPGASGNLVAPKPDGGFAFLPDDILAYYEGEGYVFEDPQASSQAAGWWSVRCLRSDPATGLTHIVSIVVDRDGVLGDGFSGVVGPAGTPMPSTADVATSLGGFLGALLGQEDGTRAFGWASAHFGGEAAQATLADMLVGTYVEDDENGVGIYVEVANPAYLAASAP
ncbi:MAG: hypothetical protein WCK58_17735 [Chloroflexota bacterium]